MDRDLSFVEKPIAILDRQTRQLRSKHIGSAKVQWRHRTVEEAMLDVESNMRRRYPGFSPFQVLYLFFRSRTNAYFSDG